MKVSASWWRLWGAVGMGLVFALGASAEDPPIRDTPPMVIPLDQLLKLPASAPTDAQIARKGGDTKPKWQARFRSAHKDVAEADRELQEVRDELEELAADGSAWKMSAPGIGSVEDPTNTPMNYQLSRRLKTKREESLRTRQALRDLEVEANLAGVPEEWRHTEPENR